MRSPRSFPDRTAFDRHRGGSHLPTPATPPCVRVRTRPVSYTHLLADTYALLGDWQYAAMTPKEAFPKAKAAAIKALELDSRLGEAHNSLAFVLDGFDWDLNSGGNEFRRAIELAPGYATAHHWYAWHLSCLLYTSSDHCGS